MSIFANMDHREPQINNTPSWADLLRYPTIVSLAALALSFTAILYLLRDQNYLAFSLVLFATVLDMLDGAFSRKYKITSEFGKQVDLLQDVVNYLVFPALFFYRVGLNDFWGLVVLNIFVICGVLRLARFSITGFSLGHRLRYTGLPVYLSHLLVLLYFITSNYSHWLVFFYILLIVQSLLMVSSIPFPKPRKILIWSTAITIIGVIFILL